MSLRPFYEEEEAQAEKAFLSEIVCPAQASLSPPRQTPPSLPRVIGNILRTKICVPGSLFLVESIDARIAAEGASGRKRKHQQQGAEPRVVRLLLSDGELCIQALLVSSLHSLVDGGLLREGCLVRLERFRLRVLLRHGPGAECAPPTVFLVVENILVEGDEGGKAANSQREPQLEGVAEDGHDRVSDQPETWPTTGLKMQVASSMNNNNRALDNMSQKPRTLEYHATVVPTKPQNSQRPVVNHQKSNDASTEEPVTTVKEMPGIATEDSFYPKGEDSVHPSPVNSSGMGNDGSSQRLKRARVDIEVSSTVELLPRWVSNDLDRPVKLTTLRTIPLLPYKQNWVVNVMAIVSELSDVEPSPLPPYTGKQRTARLADPSTGKRVLLTVFLDPEAFAPKVGSAVILLGVKNHRFDGGSLKKYASDRPRDGGSWWFENPENLDWCDVGHLKHWWVSTQV